MAEIVLEKARQDIQRFSKSKAKNAEPIYKDLDKDSTVQDSIEATRAFLKLSDEVVSLGSNLDLLGGRIEVLDEEAAQFKRWVDDNKPVL